MDRLEQRLRAMQVDLNGTVIRRHSVDPPRVNLRPTYPLVVQFDSAEAGTETFVHTSSLIKLAVKQLGLTTQVEDKINLRIVEIKCWAYQLSSADRVSINMDVSSLVPTIEDLAAQPIAAVNYPIIAKLSDFGSVSHPAFVGYRWPRAHQQVPVHKNSNFQIAAVAANTVNATIHVHVLWNTTDVAPPVEVPFTVLATQP